MVQSTKLRLARGAKSCCKQNLIFESFSTKSQSENQGGSILICGSKVRYVSPRLRAQRTLELLQLGCRHTYPWRDQGKQQVTGNRRDTIEAEPERSDARIIVTDDIREWEYGEYEGITSHEIRERRDEQGLPAPWDIWRDGCPGGEYVF